MIATARSMLWLLATDTSRLRKCLVGARAGRTRRALPGAAAATGVRIIAQCIIPCGVRAIVEATCRGHVRNFARRFFAMTAAAVREPVFWRAGLRIEPIAPAEIGVYRSYLQRSESASTEVPLKTSTGKLGRRTAVRRAHALLQLVDRANAAEIGHDETSSYARRYTMDHDPPADDRAAFARLCAAIFANGIGFNAVRNHREALDAAFDLFDPTRVARYDDARIDAILRQPIICDRAKVAACVENARRWLACAADEGTYLGRVARCAAQDDAAVGWPALVELLRSDFVRVAEMTARQVLKRWGFFTALSHPGGKRCLERLGLMAPQAPAPAAQQFIGAIAGAGGRDPYALEASFVLFSTIGPCRTRPLCLRCPLAERCPAAQLEAAPPRPAASSTAAKSA